MESFEKHTRKQLQNRTLRPSDNAWCRMEQMLDQKQPLKKRNKYGWWAAAGIILFISLWIIPKQKTTSVETVIPERIVVQDTFSPVQKVLNRQQPVAVKAPDVKPKMLTEKKPKTLSVKETDIPSLSTVHQSEKIIVFKEESEKVLVKKEIAVISPVTVKQIEVSRSKLLRSAEMERQMDNSYTGGQNFWKNLKRINTVADNTK